MKDLFRKLSSKMSLNNMIVGTRFLKKLPSFLQNPTSLDEARKKLKDRLSRRENNFLFIIRRNIYDYPESPYLKLLKAAGVEYGDVRRLVRKDGIESSLQTLYEQGVYITVDEFKGRRVVIRGSTQVETNPDLLRSPSSEFHVPAKSSGSRSGGTPMMFDLSFIRDCGVNTYLALNARGGKDWLKAIWETPGAGARFRLLKLSSFGEPVVRWFSQVDPGGSDLDSIFKWSERALRWGSKLGGVPLPYPLHVTQRDSLAVAHWISDVLQNGNIPFLLTYTSSAVSMCQAAYESGIDLRGAQFTLGGEPTTKARIKSISRTGANPVPRYGSMECGPIGYGCLEPEAPDDVHLLQDLHALIQPASSKKKTKNLPESSLFISSLHPASPFTMLNVSMGDQASFVNRQCGCPMERLGWTTHLHTIRSYEKLTGSGMTFLDTDVIRVLEEVLPARFGGAPTDYQLLEEESEDGHPRLILHVNPRLGPLDPDKVAEIFLNAIGAASPVEKMMEVMWRDADILRVERRAPISTHSGKILHLYSNRS